MIRSGLFKSLALGRAAAAAAPAARRSMQVVPRLGSEAEMTKEAVQQLRARVDYQKALLATKGHSQAAELAEMWRWVNITFWVGVPIVLLSGFYSAFFDEHPHRFEGELPEYMKVRSKEFPWACGDCDIFDGACWKKCRAEGSG